LDTLLPPSSKVAAAKTTSSTSSNSLKSFSKKVAKKFRSSSALRSQKSKHKDQIRVFRDMISGWSLQQLSCLVAEFQSAAALRELALTSDLSRRHAPTLAEDLNRLLESGSWTYDINLRYGNLRIPAHRCILANRCAFFRQLLRNNSNKEVDVVLPDDVKLDDENFRALIRYLYTGDVQTTWSCSPTALRTFIRLKQKFGSPHTLEYDLFSMWRDRLDTDAVLIFVPSARFEHSMSADFSCAENESQAPSPYLRSTSTINRHREVKCHSVVLAARSGFFRRLIQRRHGAKEFDASKPMRIMLDESVIHRPLTN
jgi:hypothetical protein